MNEYWREIFGWSWSRQRTWETCKLRYYYSYIGKWEGFKGEMNREKLQWLSKKTDSVMLEGQLIHEAIESQVNQWAIGRPVSKDAARSLYAFRLDQVRKSPRDFLIDEINGYPVPQEKFEEVKGDGLELLDAFFDIVWPNYEGYKYVKHEQFDSFEIDSLKVWTKVDLVTQMEDGTYVVTDWKTGKVDDPSREQLLGYIIWAMQAYKVDETRVKAEVRYLRDPGGQPTPVKATKKELDDFRAFMVANAKAMFAVSSEADFSANASDRNCKKCAFATVCPDGTEFVPAGARSTPIKIGAAAAP